MKASIYTMNKGAKVVYQHANSRAINTQGVWTCETKKNGEWVPAANRWLNIVRRAQRELNEVGALSL